ncbi:MAG TPA: transcription termination factor Rho [Actinomycetota bacterium]|nr:transcription termination factor Rho [Actinomycetota bacterium]
MDKSALEGKVAAELHQMATDLGIEGHQRLKKADLIDSILAHENGEAVSGQARERTTAEEAPAAPATAAADGGGNGEVPNEARPAAATATEASTEAPTGGRERTDRDRRPDASERTDRGQRDRTDRQERQDRPERQERHERPEGQRPEGGRRRPSREERRRQREERRQREFEMREEELANAPTATGLLDILPEGYGFLRTSGFLPAQQDIYVSLSQVRRFMLRKGDTVTGKVRQPKDNEKYFALLQIDTVNDLDPETAKSRPVFEKLTPLFPHDRFRLETGPTDVTGRIIDMVAPIGKGQRGMVVSPPKAGKTTVLKNIANGIISSSPETHVIILLVDERPEEVTDWQRTVTPAEVVYSTFDKPPDQHIQVTELVLERAKRLAEMGRDVAIILDSITRLARAYNLAAPASGKILSGGIDSTALYPPRRFFGAARNIEEGGSLTIIASALVETGSRMDEGIFEEFKGTGNMELRLDRQLSEKRLFPAINVEASGTRKEELLMPTEELALVWRLRRVLHALEPAAALELLTDKIRTTKSNEQFLKEIEKVKA